MRRLRGAPPLERRLFVWLFAAGAAPALVVLLVSWWISAGSLGWLGGLGAWDPLADSGRELLEAVEPLAAGDPALRDAADRHRTALGISLVQAQRWSYLGDRLRGMLPLLFIVLMLLLAGFCLVVARQLARGFSRPVRDLVQWSERLGREEALPEPSAAERREPREIGTLRTALRAAAAELADARHRRLESERLRAWSELARRVAHEMKNPLTPLRLAAHRVSRVAGHDPAVAESLAIIDTESGRLEALAAEFGTLGRPPEGTLSEVDVHELCSRLLQSDVPPGIEAVITGERAVVVGYYDALLRAFRNLLRNAVEAVADRPQPRVELGVERGEGVVVVAIGDNGTGVPPDLLERIFDADVTLKRGGTGLGLAIVRQAVAAHGGRVSARARADGGAEFVVELPADGHSPAADRYK